MNAADGPSEAEEEDKDAKRPRSTSGIHCCTCYPPVWGRFRRIDQPATETLLAGSRKALGPSHAHAEGVLMVALTKHGRVLDLLGLCQIVAWYSC